MRKVDTGGNIDTCGNRTLLDYFAGQALVGMLTHEECFTSPAKTTLWAYEQAAAMIAEKRRLEELGNETVHNSV